MANEGDDPGPKEPPWLPILPPMSRISVSSSSRARLSHRRPVLFSPPTLSPSSTPSCPPVVVAPSVELPSFRESPDKSSESQISETLNPTSPILPVVGSSLQCPSSHESLPKCSTSLIMWETLGPSSPPTSASYLESGAEAPLCGTSSHAGLEIVGSSIATEADAPSHAVFEPVKKSFHLKNDDFVGDPNLEGTVSECGPSPKSEQCIFSTDSSRWALQFPTPRISSLPVALTLKPDSGEAHQESGNLQEKVAAGVMGLEDGVNDAKYEDVDKLNGRVSITPGDTVFTSTVTSSFASCLHASEEVGDECRGANITENQDNCSIVGPEPENSDLVKSDELGLERQLPGYEANEVKDLGYSRPCEDRCTSSEMEVSVAEPSLSLSRLNALEEVDEFKGADLKLDQEDFSGVSHQDNISEVVEDEDLKPEEGELEEGQLSGEWSGPEESHEDVESARIDDSTAMSTVVRGNHMIPETVNVANQIYYPSQVEQMSSQQRGPGNSKAKGKKKKKHKKGEGSRKRSREKSKEKHNEVLKKRKVEVEGNGKGKGKGKGIGNGKCGLSNLGGEKSEDRSGRGEQTRNNNGSRKLTELPDRVSPTKAKAPVVDDGPEDGEILLETNSGILSSLVDSEVGLWTTDDVDDQFVTEIEVDGAVKRKRVPETAERKQKRKILKRKKRAQKERELGIRRPRTVPSKPVKVLCTHYMKGRCAKGDQCTFSHDAVPLTKQEPCKFFMSHSCLKGDDCPYSHELGAFPCKFFHTRGLCYDGDNCQFSHGAISEEALEKLRQRADKEKKERVSSTSGLDVPTPSFSTTLAPDLDPDPLGWGSASLYASHEDQIQYRNPTSLDESNIFESGFNIDNHGTAPPEAGTMGGPSVGFLSSASDRTKTNTDTASPPQTEWDAKERTYLELNNANPLESNRSLDLRQCDRHGSILPTISASSEDPCFSSIPRVLNTALCQSHEMSNAMEFSEAQQMQGKIDQSTSPALDLFTSPNALNTQAVPTRIAAPLMMGRRLGSLVVEHKNAQNAPQTLVSKRQNTVDSLLDEALRQ